jgi:hypothetical protein
MATKSAAKLSDFDPDAPLIKKFIRDLGNPAVILDLRLGLAAQSIVHFYNEAADRKKKSNFITAVLNQVAENVRNVAFLKGFFCSLADRLCGDDKDRAKNIKTVITVWYRWNVMLEEPLEWYIVKGTLAVPLIDAGLRRFIID